MGLSTFFSDVWDTFSHPSPDADSPPQGGSSTSTPASGTPQEGGDEADANVKDAQKQQGKGDDGEVGHKPSKGGDDEEEEEEEEQEERDIKEVLEEQCAESKQCSPAKHHYDHCVERVTAQIDNDGKAKEDCVEEFFHLVHCSTQCAAPKLFRELK